MLNIKYCEANKRCRNLYFSNLSKSKLKRANLQTFNILALKSI
jgi:hypothetical protein